MENIEIKTKIIELLKSTKREGVDKLIDWLKNKSDFFTAPSSKDKHSNFVGGNAYHSYSVYTLLEDKCQYWAKKADKRDGLLIPDQNSRKIIALMHDISKSNFYTKTFKNVKKGKKINFKGKEVDNWVEKEVYDIDDKFPLNHGCKSVIMLQNFIKLEAIEILAIAHHMGIPENYIDKITFNNALKLCPFILLLHTADFESSYLLEEIKEDE